MPTTIYDSSLITQRSRDKVIAQRIKQDTTNGKPIIVPQAGYGSYLLGEADNGNITYFRQVDSCMNVDLSCNCTGSTTVPVIRYTLTYNYNETQGGTGTEPTPTAYSGGSAVAISTNPGFSATGKSFGGWNTSADGTGTYYPPGSTLTMPYANTTLWAQWYDPTGPLYTVTYDGNGDTGGSVPLEADYSQYQGVPISGNTYDLQRTGFTFSGWNTAADGSGTPYPVTSNGFTMPASNVTLYAQWTPIPTYTVTYNGNNSTGGSVPVDGSSPYTGGSTVTVLGNTGSLTRTGFTFAGWNTAANGSGTSYSPSNTFTINANTILYAQWTPVGPSSNYTVTYFGNTNTGGTAPTDGSSPYTGGSTVTILGNPLAPNTLVKTTPQVFGFGGWNTQPDGSGTNYVGGSTFTINADTNLYANWIVPAVSVRYFAGTGGSGIAPASSGTFYPAYSTANIVGNTGPFTNGSLVFGGWNTAADGSGTYYPAGSTYSLPGSGSVTLYAQWINPATTYTLTYNAGTGGSGIAPASPTTYSANTPAAILGNTGPYTNSDPTKVFYGWNTAADGTGTSYPAGSTITMNTNKTLYAQWVSNTSPYTVTYDANGATGGAVPAAPTNYPAGVQVPILGQGSLTRTGYVFLGWNGSPTGAGSLYAPGFTFLSKTATLYAQWAPGSVARNCGGGSGSGIYSIFHPFAQTIVSTDTITIYTTALYGSTSTNYGSGLAPEGIISVASKTVITSATITINTNTTYLDSLKDYNYAHTITNGSGVTYWPSGATLSSVTFPTLSTTTNSLPVTYRLSNRNCTNGCGLLVTAGGGVYSPTINSLAFFNQGVTLNYSNGTNTIFVASPTNAFYSVLGSTTSPIVWSTTPTNFYPYALITPRSSAALTTITILPSTASEYIYPPMPDYTLQYDGNGATSGSIPPPRYFLPYNTAPSPAPNPAPPAPPNTLPYTVVGNTGSLIRSGFTFSRWNTAADGSGTNYGPGYTTTYAGGASITLYAIWV